MTRQFVPGRGYSRAEWDAVDSPEMTDEEIAGLRPMKEALPDLYVALQAEIGKRGPTKTKEAISIRLDMDIVAKLRASGPGWQSRVNDALREWLGKSAA